MEGLKISWKSPKCAECVTDKNYCIIKIEKSQVLICKCRPCSTDLPILHIHRTEIS